MRNVNLVLLLALICAPGFTAQIGWQFTFDSADFGGGRYGPVVADGVAHYVLEHGYIANVQQEFPALPVAETPFFGLRARDVKGGIFVKFKIDGEWQKSWVIAGWKPSEFETKYVDLRPYGDEVSGIWLNSQSSIDGAEWFLDWLGFVKSDNPMNVRIVTPGGLVKLPDERALSLDLRNDLGADARLLCMVKGLPPDDAFQSQQSVDAAAGEDRSVGMRVPAHPGARYELSIADRDTKTVLYQALLTVPPAIEARMVVPAYRNAIYATQNVDQIRVEGTLNILPPLIGDMRIRTRLMQGDRALHEAETAGQGLDIRLAAPVQGLAPGEYSLEIEAMRGEQLLGEKRLPLHVYGPHPNEVRVDENLNTRINGEPFLPVGFYSVPLKYLETVANAGFNAVLSYNSNTESLQTYLDEAARVGVKAVVHTPGLWFGQDGEQKLREAVAALKDKPALLGWYLTDEPNTGSPGRAPEDMARLYALMQELDPYHPTFTVYCRTGEFALYRNTHDVFMCDPYPVGNRALTFVSDWTELGKEAMQGTKPVHIVPQSFGSEKGPQTWWHLPTAEQEICMGYLALVHGAKGLFYYRFDVQQYDKKLADQGKWPWPTIGYLPELRPETWAGFETLGPQLKQLAPVILAPEPEAKVTVSPEKSGLHLTQREFEGKRYLIAVNPEEQTVDATITVEGLTETEVDVLFEKRQVSVKAGAFDDRFQGSAVHVYRFKQR